MFFSNLASIPEARRNETGCAARRGLNRSDAPRALDALDEETARQSHELECFSESLAVLTRRTIVSSRFERFMRPDPRWLGDGSSEVAIYLNENRTVLGADGAVRVEKVEGARRHQHRGRHARLCATSREWNHGRGKMGLMRSA